MTKAQLEARMVKNNAKLDKLIDTIITDAKAYKEANPERSYFDLHKSEDLIDSGIQGLAEVRDILEGCNERKSLRKKVRKVLGYITP